MVSRGISSADLRHCEQVLRHPGLVRSGLDTIPQRNDALRNDAMTTTERSPLLHEFDSSQTCDYCGVDESEARRLGSRLCPKRNQVAEEIREKEAVTVAERTEPKAFRININAKCSVKLSAIGVHVLRHYDEQIQNDLKKYAMDYSIREFREGDVFQDQLHRIMCIFGPHIRMGGASPFVSDFEVLPL